MSIVAMSDIPEGTEVLVKYGYDMRIAPQWYKQLYEDFKQGLTLFSHRIPSDSKSILIHQ